MAHYVEWNLFYSLKQTKKTHHILQMWRLTIQKISDILFRDLNYLAKELFDQGSFNFNLVELKICM